MSKDSEDPLSLKNFTQTYGGAGLNSQPGGILRTLNNLIEKFSVPDEKSEDVEMLEESKQQIDSPEVVK